MSIIVDYTAVINVEKNVGAYIGAGNFAREIIMLIKKETACIKVVVYNDFSPKEGNEADALSNLELIKVDDLVHTNFGADDKLFLPVTNGYILDKVRRIKSKSNISIYAVVHDKQHNVDRYDPYDRFYNSGIDRILFVSFAKWIIKHAAYNALYSKWIGNIDKLFTVSNYSLQKLDNKKLGRVVLFYQGTSFSRNNNTEYVAEFDDFILFVSGNRSEKNLLRALIAFRKFRHIADSKTKLYITGIKEGQLYSIAKGAHINREFIDYNVVFRDYVPDGELESLYKKCRYVLYVSKGEGFGLPVLEALHFGKTVLASRQTSIPEVAGGILYYVNAYDVNSIFEGMKYLSEDENLRYRESLIPERMNTINRQIALDRSIMIHEIMN